ncbi:MAG TPA: ABC transporter permease [Bryobacteraceae bacterium]|nr:ABC transporter permease [Bryobacteraceae bacterium]
MRGVRHIEAFAYDLRHDLRALRRKPTLAAGVIAILALGIGASTAVFSVVDAVLLRPLPYPSAGRLVKIQEGSTKRDIGGLPAADYLELRKRIDVFDNTAAYVRDDVTATGMGEPDRAIIGRTSAGLFSLLGIRARLGRALLEADDNPSAPNVAVLSDRFWQRVYRGDPGVVGRTIRLSGEPYTIAGVMPPEFEFEFSKTDLWIPLRLTAAFNSHVGVVARVKPEVSIPQVRSAVEVAARQLEREDPQEKAGLRIVVSPWRETPAREYEVTLVFVLAAVGLVLMIACLNVTSLLLSRAVQRQKEIAIRASLGAGRWQVMRQLLAESFALTLAGSAAGIVIAYYALEYLIKQLTRLPGVLPHLQRIAIDRRVLLFDIVLCLVLACIISLAPILMASKTDLQAALRGGQRAGGPKTSTRLFSILIASEAAFAFLSLAGSGLMIRSLVRLEEADHGFHPDHVLTLRVPVGSLRQLQAGGKYDTKPQQMAYYHELVERLHRVPGVKALAVVNNLPLSDVNTAVVKSGPTGREVLVEARTISPEYFNVMGTRLIAGRFFSDSDQAGSPAVAIINQRLAGELFPGRNAVGEKLPGEGSSEGETVVGVVQNAPQTSYEKPPEGEMYLTYRQFIFGAFMSTIVVRTSGNPLALADSLKRAVWTVDATQPIVKIETMNDVIADSIWRPRFSAWIFSVLGGLALLLTSAGVYAVVAYTTTLRTREVGIRVAMGATPRAVVAVILRGALIPLAGGLALSFVAAVLLSHLLASVLYEISGTDPVAYLSAGALLLVIGVIASARPAWSAATGDPMQALRAD